MLNNAHWTTPLYPSKCLACHRPIAVGEAVYAPCGNRCNVYCGACGPHAEAAVARKRELLAAGADLQYPVSAG